MNDAMPISPDEIAGAKLQTIPDFVIWAVNTLLTKRFTGHGREIIIKQDEIIAEAEKVGRATGTLPEWANRQSFFSEGWLNFEPLFAQHGWKVKYDKPSYDESYDAHFIFISNPVG